MLDDRRTHDLRNRRQTRRLRDRVFLGTQITAEDRRVRCRDPLQTLFCAKRDPPALDAVKINRGRLTLDFAERRRSFPEQWQSLMFPHWERGACAKGRAQRSSACRLAAPESQALHRSREDVAPGDLRVPAR